MSGNRKAKDVLGKDDLIVIGGAGGFIGGSLARHFTEHGFTRIRAVDTICNATAVRQREAVALAADVEAMVVVGGRDSANTGRLVELCRASRPDATYHVESAEELPLEALAGRRVVGVTAGASTPEWVIAEVVQRLREL